MYIISIAISCFIIWIIYFFIIRTAINVFNQKKLVSNFVLDNSDELSHIDIFIGMNPKQIINYFSSYINDFINITRKMCKGEITNDKVDRFFLEACEQLISKIEDPSEKKILHKFSDYCKDQIHSNYKKYC